MAGISGDVAALVVGGGSNSITIFNHCICCTRSASVSCFSPRICLSSSSTSFCRLPRRFALSAYPMVKTAPIPTGRVSDLFGFVGDLRSNVYCGAAQLISSSHHEVFFHFLSHRLISFFFFKTCNPEIGRWDCDGIAARNPTKIWATKWGGASSPFFWLSFSDTLVELCIQGCLPIGNQEFFWVEILSWCWLQCCRSI